MRTLARTVVSVIGVRPFKIGGAETFARELSIQLGQSGWTSVLAFPSEPSDAVRNFLDLPNTRIEKLDLVSVNRKSLQNLRRTLQHYRPQILHLHFLGFLTPYPWMAKWYRTRQIFFTDQRSRPEGYASRRLPVWKQIVTRTINYPLSKVIAVSDYGQRCMTALDVLPKERYVRIYNSVDLSRVSGALDARAAFRRKYGIPDGRIVVTQTSWLIHEKGIADLIEAARLVTAENRNVHFVFAGDGAHHAQFVKQTEDAGLKDHVTFTGLIEDTFGEGVFAAADVLCQVSRWEEVFGWVIAEGMAYSKPVVGTRVGGIPEVVEDGGTGYLVERRNPADIAQKILRLTNDPELRERMGRAGRMAVEAKFDLRKNVAGLLRLYGINTPSEHPCDPLVVGKSMSSR